VRGDSSRLPRDEPDKLSSDVSVPTDELLGVSEEVDILHSRKSDTKTGEALLSPCRVEQVGSSSAMAEQGGSIQGVVCGRNANNKDSLWRTLRGRRVSERRLWPVNY
jgi:hypothetical protein